MNGNNWGAGRIIRRQPSRKVFCLTIFFACFELVNASADRSGRSTTRRKFLGQRMASKADPISGGADGLYVVRTAFCGRGFTNSTFDCGHEAGESSQSFDCEGHGLRSERHHPRSANSYLEGSPLSYRRGIFDQQWLVRRLLNAAEH